MGKIPLIMMLLVLVAPFAVSLVLLDSKDSIADKARGEWLDTTHYVAELENRNWQILWRKQDCQASCKEYLAMLERLRIALGKNQNKVTVANSDVQALEKFDDGLFIANHKGLVLLSYQADKSGAYNLLKDLKVLLKNNTN